jgi:nucleoside 2-deoxyribosyltransferase
VGSVFLSHRYPERDDARWLRERLGAEWRVLTHAVTPEAAETWRAECRRLITEADAIVCIVGTSTAESPNVAWELKTALAVGRPVIAASSASAESPELPAPLAARGTPLLALEDVPRRLEEVALERAG